MITKGKIIMLREYLKKINIEPTEEIINKFNEFSKLLVSWNEKINLTSITEPKEIEIKHFIDSLTIFETGKIKENMKIIDIGCGAGFPSFPMKFACDSLDITMLDSLNKRINFQNEVTSEIGLSKIKSVHARAEEAGISPLYREKYDIACARAVANLSSLIELCIPFVKVGGNFIALKGSEIDEEVNNCKNALGCLGSEIEDIIHLKLPVYEHERNIIIVKKVKSTDKRFPRKAPKPIKQPL